MEKEEIKKILEDNIKLISDGIDYLNSDECIKNREEYEKWQEKNRPGSLNLTPEEKYTMSQKQIDELKESIMIAKRNYSEKEFEMGEQLRAYNEWDYSRFLNDDYEKLPSIIRYFIYDILDNTDSYNKMNKLLDILIVLLWEDNM